VFNVWLLRVCVIGLYHAETECTQSSSFGKTTAIPDTEKPTWMECLVPELMSSEESEDDGSFTPAMEK